MSRLKISTKWAWSMFIVSAVFYSFEFLLRVSPSVMVPHLMSLYNINAKQVGVLSAYYYYTYTPLQLIAGTMVDHYGTRMLLTTSIVACVIGIYFFSMTDTISLAKFGRGLIGMGSAFAFVCTLRICSDWLPDNMFATLAGITTTLGMLGAVTGEVLLENLQNTIGVQNSFIIYMIFGLFLAIITWVLVRNKNTLGQKRSSIEELKSLFGHMTFLIRKPIFWHTSIIGLCLFMPTTIFASLWAVKFISDIYHVSNAADYSSMIFIGWAVGGPLVGLISKQKNISEKNLLIFGAVMASISAILLIYFKDFSHDKLKIMLFLFGFFSSAEILIFDINHIISGPKLCGTSVALTNMVVMIGGFMQPIVGILLDQGKNNLIASYSYEQYKIALAILPASFIIGSILAMLINEEKVRPPANIPE